MVRTFDPGARPIEFGESGDVKEFGTTEEFRDFLSHRVGRTFGPVDDFLHVDFVGEASMMDLFGHQQSHRSCRAKNC